MQLLKTKLFLCKTVKKQTFKKLNVEIIKALSHLIMNRFTFHANLLDISLNKTQKFFSFINFHIGNATKINLSSKQLDNSSKIEPKQKEETPIQTPHQNNPPNRFQKTAKNNPFTFTFAPT